MLKLVEFNVAQKSCLKTVSQDQLCGDLTANPEGVAANRVLQDIVNITENMMQKTGNRYVTCACCGVVEK